MKRRFLHTCGIILTFISGIAPWPALADQTLAAKPKIVILPARVTLDGTARPDLGQSLSDIISARLLTSSAVELLDADATAGPPQRAAAVPGPLAGSLAENSSPYGIPTPPLLPAAEPVPAAPAPVATGLAMGADLVVQPTVVGQANEFRLTLRQIQVPGGKILSIISEKTSTGLKGLYALAESHALRLVPALPAPPRQTTGPTIIDHPAHYRPAPPVTAAVSDQEIALAPRALAQISPAKQAAIAATLRLLDPAASAAGPTTIGKIGEMNLEWSFCEITLKQPLELPAGTSLFVTAGGNPENLVNLTVTRVEGRKIIADFPPGPLAAALRSGDVVYYWKP